MSNLSQPNPTVKPPAPPCTYILKQLYAHDADTNWELTYCLYLLVVDVVAVREDLIDHHTNERENCDVLQFHLQLSASQMGHLPISCSPRNCPSSWQVIVWFPLSLYVPPSIMCPGGQWKVTRVPSAGAVGVPAKKASLTSLGGSGNTCRCLE